MGELSRFTSSAILIATSLGEALADAGNADKSRRFEEHGGLGNCSVYLAESSIRNAGWGVFAGRDFSEGERVGMPGLGIQVIDPDNIYDTEEGFAEFGWNSIAVGGNSEAETVFTTLPGLGMLVNFHPLLSNVIPGGLRDEPLLNRGKDPGVGSSTAYHNFTFVSEDIIYAGEEVFAAVGDGWFDHHDQNDDDNNLPLRVDHQMADKIINGLAKFLHDHPDVTEAQFLDILRRAKNEMIQNNGKLRGLIPDSIEGFLDATDRGTARAALANRDMDWLRANGKCLDNIISGISTVPGAGRGAFATRFIPKGSLIAPAPLVQVLDKTNLESDVDRNGTHNSTKQLLINYCFGHRKSSLLLCPTTSVSLINHSTDKANAQYRWSDTSANRADPRTNYRTASLDNLQPDPTKLSSFNSKLMFDFIATADIEEGEEIFIDYGDEWQNAWDQHVQHWERPDSSDSYVPASTMNAENRHILLSNDPALEHHSYLCRLELFAREVTIPSIPEEEFSANPGIDPNFWDKHTHLMYSDNEFITWWPCDVVDINSENTLFSTVVYAKNYREDSPRKKDSRVIRRLNNVPRNAIKFVDKKYHSDQHLPKAFRHYIPIPDAIFPLHWRDDYTSADSVRLGTTNVGVDIFSDSNVQVLYEKRLQEAKCGVYVAPSNIPNAGMGTYVGVSMPGKNIPLGTKVPVISVPDMSSNRPWDASDYVWSSSNYYAEFESGIEGSSSVLAINEGCMANFHPGLVNFESDMPTYEPVLDRRTDPGAGAFSDYVKFSFRSLHEVKAGDEAFISYGEHWFNRRAHLKHVPLKANYLEANRVVASLFSLSSKKDSGIEAGKIAELLQLVKSDIVDNKKTKQVLESLQSVEDLRLVMSRNGTAEATTERKSPEWLEKNGYCTDHVYSKASTIKQAGNGAFARRFIKKGQTIIPAPLIVTWGRDMFELNKPHLPQDINRKQLVYNYQYAHPDSSALFFPTNTAIMINHRKHQPNAEIRWSKTDKKSSYYLQRTLNDLKEEHYATMVLEFVATRDIHPDEEVFIDYGDEWEDSWNKHVKNFVSPCPEVETSPCFKSSRFVNKMNDDKFNNSYHAWSKDHFTVCQKSSMPMTDDALITILPNHIGADAGTNDTYLSSFREIEHSDEGFNLTTIAEHRVPCKILRVEKEEGLFDVVYFTSERSTNPELKPHAKFLRRMRTLPADMIQFINKPYRSDMFWSGAFRHEIKIPDTIFPPLWKDLLQK